MRMELIIIVLLRQQGLNACYYIFNPFIFYKLVFGLKRIIILRYILLSFSCLNITMDQLLWDYLR